MKKECNQLKGIFFVFVFSTCKEYEDEKYYFKKMKNIIFGKLVEKNP